MADELMQLEAHPLAVGQHVSLYEHSAEHIGAALRIGTGLRGEMASNLGERTGRAPLQPTIRFDGETKFIFDIAHEGVLAEGGEVCRERSIHRRAQFVGRRRVAFTERGQRLFNHLLGRERMTEEAGRKLGHAASSFGSVSIGPRHHCRASTDVKERLRFAALFQTAHEHCDIRPLPTAIGVEFVEDQEAQRGGIVEKSDDPRRGRAAVRA